jgi:glycosyltransferase involved in cell wall biosynthesis
MRHGIDFFLAEGPDEFAVAASRLLTDPAFRSALAGEGYRRVLEGYSWNVIAGRLEDCYEKIVDEHRVPNRNKDAARVQYAL